MFKNCGHRAELDLTNGMQDPFQFAYKPNRSIEDAILTLLHNTFRHTNNPKSYVRILFDDFLSAFNSIEPYHLAKKLVRLNISPKLAIQIINFLSHRKQFVRFKGVLSGERSISTGVPQGYVLSPVLFTLYTNYCTGTENTIFIKYSDDTAIVDNTLVSMYSRRRTKLYFNSQHVNDTIYKHSVSLGGYLGRHQTTNNCLCEMSSI